MWWNLLYSCNFIKNQLQHRCFSVFLWTLQNFQEQLSGKTSCKTSCKTSACRCFFAVVVVVVDFVFDLMNIFDVPNFYHGIYNSRVTKRSYKTELRIMTSQIELLTLKFYLFLIFWVSNSMWKNFRDFLIK